LHAAAREYGIEEGDDSQENRRTYALYLAGKSDKHWTKDELIRDKKKACWKIYLLGVDYQRWLCEERRFAPIVADELRHLVIDAANGINCPFRVLLTGLPHQAFDQYLAKSLGFMSLDRIHAPASVIAVKHYYDFLSELELVKPGVWHESQAVCDGLWKQLQRTISDEEWQSYRFLEQCWPQ
jgi:hypothetical protein